MLTHAKRRLDEGRAVDRIRICAACTFGGRPHFAGVLLIRPCDPWKNCRIIITPTARKRCRPICRSTLRHGALLLSSPDLSLRDRSFRGVLLCLLTLLMFLPIP